MDNSNVSISLPILNFKNYDIFKDWHEYYYKVYRQRITYEQEVDLNTFTWFYNYAPIPNNATHYKIRPHEMNTIPDNSLFKLIGEPYFPEVIISNQGYFKKSNFDNDHLNEKYIEVMRTNTGEGAMETNVVWFYHTIGSGFYIKKENIAEIILNNEIHHLTEIKMNTNGKKANDLDIDIFFKVKNIMNPINIIYKNNILHLDY